MNKNKKTGKRTITVRSNKRSVSRSGTVVIPASVRSTPAQLSAQDTEPRLYRIAGPVAVAKNLHAKMYDVVLVGTEQLLGEVIQISGDKTIIQVYEDTSGLKPGEPVLGTGKPLSVELGPGLLASIYDGIQRPLPALMKATGNFISRGARLPGLDQTKKWEFVATAKNNDVITGGAVLGYVEEVPGFKHYVLVPPTVAGTVSKIQSGSYTVNDTIAIVTTKNPLTDASEKNGTTQTSLTMKQFWPVRKPRPVATKLAPNKPLITGQRILDTLFPIAKGGTAIVSGPFGAGKTVTQHQLAKWSDAEIIVYIGCGERGNEMTEVLVEFPELKDPRNGAPLMNRTVLIANTSNMPVAAREASIYTGITIGEYFRDMGYDVAIMADSTSRWAEALREISSRLEEMPGEEGFPAYLSSRVAEFYERAAIVIPLKDANNDVAGVDSTNNGKNNSVHNNATKETGANEIKPSSLSVIGAVSPPGGDFFEPVTQSSLRVAKAFWALDARIAQRRHFPSINWLEGYTLYKKILDPWYAQNVANDWAEHVEKIGALLQEEAQLMEIVQLVGSDALPDQQQLTLQVAKLIREGLLQQSAYDPLESYCPIRKSYLLMKLMITYHALAGKTLNDKVRYKQIDALQIPDKIYKFKYCTEYEKEAGIIEQEMATLLASLQQKTENVKQTNEQENQPQI